MLTVNFCCAHGIDLKYGACDRIFGVVDHQIQFLYPGPALSPLVDEDGEHFTPSYSRLKIDDYAYRPGTVDGTCRTERQRCSSARIWTRLTIRVDLPRDWNVLLRCSTPATSELVVPNFYLIV